MLDSAHEFCYPIIRKLNNTLLRAAEGIGPMKPGNRFNPVLNPTAEMPADEVGSYTVRFCAIGRFFICKKRRKENCGLKMGCSDLTQEAQSMGLYSQKEDLQNEKAVYVGVCNRRTS